MLKQILEDTLNVKKVINGNSQKYFKKRKLLKSAKDFFSLA